MCIKDLFFYIIPHVKDNLVCLFFSSCRLLVVGCWLSVVGCRLLAVGCWISVVGFQLSGVGSDCRVNSSRWLLLVAGDQVSVVDLW
jgi:hypothetical protein